MNILDISTFEYFLNRFYHCYDCIIRCITMITTDGSNTSKAQVILSVRDEEGTDDGWVNLSIKIENLTDFIGSNPENYTNEVLSDGIKIGFYDGLIYLDLEPYTDEPEGIEDFKRSNCLFIGKEIYWETMIYSEDC